MKILFVSSEGVPFSKTGGLADVIGALPLALKEKGTEAKIILPLYKSTREKYGHQMEKVAIFQVDITWRKREARVFHLKKNKLDYYFIEGGDYFERDACYGYYDDGERFAFFSKAVLEFLEHLDYTADIIHLSEWQTALLAVYLKTLYKKREGYEDFISVFTIHNINYQGIFGLSFQDEILGLDEEGKRLVTHMGKTNLMKGAIEACDLLTTVSPTYAEEIKSPEFGMGLEAIIAAKKPGIVGILNGIDYSEYDPGKDLHIIANYSKESLEGKALCKKSLQEERKLPLLDKMPLITMVTRLTQHKGINLLIDSFQLLMERDLQLVIIGSGEKDMEHFFKAKALEYPKNFSFEPVFDENLARRAYSGADIFLMPSFTEPCGLAQMIAARYASPPIVRETGGLADSIINYGDHGDLLSNGFVFKGNQPADLLAAIDQALNLYKNSDAFTGLQRQAMVSDFSWRRGAEEYIKLYSKALREFNKDDEDGPSWLTEGIMYQIFPDRFKRSLSYKIPPMDKDYILREDWGGDPHGGPFEDGKWNKEFFGGNLAGIQEELDYLENLGVTVIYLNPIFESFSNHRYDTGDFKKIDPMLGDDSLFQELLEEADKKGIRIILDGVFNHTGSDSIYFNKEGRYPELGAYQSKNSIYYPWFDFINYPDTYYSWWGIKSLPQVKETEPSYMDFIARKEDSVIRKWMRMGIGGFRLDVADELPDEFLDLVAATIRTEKSDGTIIGEVWEDASTKVAYGQRRRYFKKRQLDSVMNYPLKESLISYLTDHHNGERIKEEVEKIWENYPRRNFNRLMNILGTHDTERIFTVLKKGLSYEAEEYHREVVAFFVWALMPGIPCLYYGDELGYTGGREPDNRKCFSKENKDEIVYNSIKEILDFRRGIEEIGLLEYAPYQAFDGVFSFMRRGEGCLLLVFVNAGEEIKIEIPPEIIQDMEEESSLFYRVDRIQRNIHNLKKNSGLAIYFRNELT